MRSPVSLGNKTGGEPKRFHRESGSTLLSHTFWEAISTGSSILRKARGIPTREYSGNSKPKIGDQKKAGREVMS